MEIHKMQKDNNYISTPEFDELREFAQAWSDRAGGQKLRNLIAQLDKVLHTNYVKLPVDSEGEMWTGDESRMICHIEGKEDHEQPTDYNPAFCDGLIYSGGLWYVYSQSANGKNIAKYPAETCRHVQRSETTDLLNLLDSMSLDLINDLIKALKDSYETIDPEDLKREAMRRIREAVSENKR